MSDERNERPDMRVVIFEGQAIRRQWRRGGDGIFSVIDVVRLLAEAAKPRTYWAQLKAGNLALRVRMKRFRL